jgi:hypothetical protein
MAEKENLMFADPEIKPTDDLIFSIIGERKADWQSIMDYLRQNYPDSSGIWNYYKDGKRWLFKMTMKKKTLFWVGIFEDTFRITFYFGNKADLIIETSDLPQILKDGFKTAKKYGAIKPISVKILEHSDVETVLKLIAIKSKLK